MRFKECRRSCPMGSRRQATFGEGRKRGSFLGDDVSAANLWKQTPYDWR
jgi:hypothetical protein